LRRGACDSAKVLACTGTNPDDANTVRHGSGVLPMAVVPWRATTRGSTPGWTRNRSILATASASEPTASMERLEQVRSEGELRAVRPATTGASPAAGRRISPPAPRPRLGGALRRRSCARCGTTALPVCVSWRSRQRR
ncbi:hypothetical protein BAE44_0024933, partial [Dichanthelium oligosanthes]